MEYSFTRRKDVYGMLNNLIDMGLAPDMESLRAEHVGLEAAASRTDFMASALLLGTSEFPSVFRTTPEEVRLCPCRENVA